ncbi:MAG: sterol carrier protein domain-containing protein, partial [bacterium]|nr:sterol carrier protein domain-containing protein [bacterium]
DRIAYNTKDENFHLLLHDVSNGTDNLIPSLYHESNISGVGIMYRIISLNGFINATKHRNYSRVNLSIILHLQDSLCGPNQGIYYLNFVDGALSISPSAFEGVEMKVDIADFSALLMGAVDFNSLYTLGRITASKEHIMMLSRAFYMEQKPHCLSAF